MGKIKAMIWDVGGVIALAKDKSKRNAKNLHSSLKELWVLLKGIDIEDENLFEKFQKVYFKDSRGEISREETLSSLSKIFSTSEFKIEKIIQSALKKNTTENKVLLKFISKLKNEGYKQGILSIQWSISNDIAIPENYDSIFENKVISFIDKVTKPSLESFKLIINKMNILPEQAIFIDDKQENLDAAIKLGITPILFKNNKQLKKDFVELGIK